MGAGAFGTALAVSISRLRAVALWTRDAAHAEEMAKTRRNDRRLPGVPLPDAIRVETGTVSDPAAEATLLAVPAQKLRDFTRDHGAMLSRAGPLVACCKGIELKTGDRPTQILSETVPGAVCATLTGPSFASDIARGLPTALTLACADTDTGQRLQSLLSTHNLRLYRSPDVIGAELGGALKNVIAIACGAAIGAGLGESARAAVMTRGFAEMVRAARKMGADPETLNGLSGFGDLVLTCTSDQSRNYRYGLSLGRNSDFDASVTVEGAATAQAVAAMARETDLDLPITSAIDMLVTGQLQVTEAMNMLLARPLKDETC